MDEYDIFLGAEGEAARAALIAAAEALAGIDTGAIEDLNGVALAGLRRGWAGDPTFAAWTGPDLTHWTTTGVTTYGSQVAGA